MEISSFTGSHRKKLQKRNSADFSVSTKHGRHSEKLDQGRFVDSMVGYFVRLTNDRYVRNDMGDLQMIKIGECKLCGPINLVQFVLHDASCGIVYTITENVYDYKKDFKIDPPRNPYSSGYGQKISTEYWIEYANGRSNDRARWHPRWHRVYVMQYGNAGSAYILVRGKIMFLDSTTESRLESL